MVVYYSAIAALRTGTITAAQKRKLLLMSAKKYASIAAATVSG